MENIISEEQAIIVEFTNEENASLSWDDPDKMIKQYPYHAKLKGFGGGYFENIDEIKKFYSEIRGSEKITGCGKWEVEK